MPSETERRRIQGKGNLVGAEHAPSLAKSTSFKAPDPELPAEKRIETVEQ